MRERGRERTREQGREGRGERGGQGGSERERGREGGAEGQRGRRVEGFSSLFQLPLPSRSFSSLSPNLHPHSYPCPSLLPHILLPIMSASPMPSRIAYIHGTVQWSPHLKVPKGHLLILLPHPQLLRIHRNLHHRSFLQCQQHPWVGWQPQAHPCAFAERHVAAKLLLRIRKVPYKKVPRGGTGGKKPLLAAMVSVGLQATRVALIFGVNFLVNFSAGLAERARKHWWSPLSPQQRGGGHGGVVQDLDENGGTSSKLPGSWVIRDGSSPRRAASGEWITGGAEKGQGGRKCGR